MRRLAALLVLAAAVAAGIVLGTRHDSKPPVVTPVPHATTPTQQARNLEAWLRRYSG
jgi:hypothetical protein